MDDLCSPLYKGGTTNLKVGVNELEGGEGGVNTVETLKLKKGGGS